MTKVRVLEIIGFVRSRPELAGTRVVLGGPEVTHHVDRFLDAGADVVVIGEGEETMRELVAAWGRPPRAAQRRRRAGAAWNRRHCLPRPRRRRFPDGGEMSARRPVR